MLHAVLRVFVSAQVEPERDGKKLAAQHWYYYSSLPEDLNLYILQCYKREHPDRSIVPEHNIRTEYDPLSDLASDVQLHTMLNWIVQSGWTLTNMSSSSNSESGGRDEVYLFTRHLSE